MRWDTVNSMNRTSLSSLYRRLTAGTPVPALDADDLAAAAEGTLPADRLDRVAQELASSPAHADVFHMLRDLKRESEALAEGVARARRETTHRRHQRADRRIAAGHRFVGARRWAAALAACLVAVVGVWSLRHAQTSSDPSAASGRSVARADVIFSPGDFGVHDRIFSDSDAHAKASRNSDVVFRADFSGGG